MSTAAPRFKKIIRFTLGLAATLLLTEALYRWDLSRTVQAELERRLPADPPVTFHAYSVPPWQFHRAMGFSYVPKPWRAAQINDGHFTGCSLMGRGDQFGNYDLHAEKYAEADVRLAIFGASYSMTGYTEGRMVNHALSEKLSAASGRRVHTLNFSRDGTGVLTFFDAARAVIPDFKPDAAIFLINALGMAFPRHWRMVAPADERFRRLYMLFEPVEDIRQNPRAVPHAAVINDDITDEWCERATDNDPLVAALIKRHFKQTHEQPKPRIAIDFWRLDRSFALNFLRHGDAYHRMRLFQGQPQYSTHGLHRFTDDAGFRAAVAELKRLRVPIVLVHIPTLPEMRRTDGTADFVYEGVPPLQGKGLVTDLEASTGERMTNLYDLYSDAVKQDPTSLVASEQDWHPSPLGTEMMADALSRLLLSRADIRSLLGH